MKRATRTRADRPWCVPLDVTQGIHCSQAESSRLRVAKQMGRAMERNRRRLGEGQSEVGSP
eukprot:919171-Karenia_brevis.AAC.1